MSTQLHKMLTVHTSFASQALLADVDDAAYRHRIFEKMLRGMQKYLQQSARQEIRSDTDYDTVFKTTYAGLVIPHTAQTLSRNAPHVLLVPSLINDHRIFDLNAERSMLRWLDVQGFYTTLLRWHDFDKQIHAGTDVQHLLQAGIMPAINALATRHDGPVFLIGYCLGGTLAALSAIQTPEDIAGAVFITAPWDMRASSDDYLNGQETLVTKVHRIRQELQGRKLNGALLPSEALQTVFASIDPLQAVRKYTRFADYHSASDIDLFVSVENWLNSGVDLPVNLMETIMSDWYGRNSLKSGVWFENNMIGNRHQPDFPALVIAAQQDRIVPYQSALSIGAVTTGPHHFIRLSGGHISVFAGKNAKKTTWKKIAAWLHENT